jgi:hypothetical protein
MDEFELGILGWPVPRQQGINIGAAVDPPSV